MAIQPTIATLERIADQVLAHAACDRRVTEVGAFSAIIDDRLPIAWRSFALPRTGAEPAEVSASLPEVTAFFGEAHRSLRFEYFEALHPALGGQLEAAGFQLRGRQPIMRCQEQDLESEEPRGLEVRALTPSDPQASFERFIDVRDRAFGDPTEAALIPVLIDEVRRGLAAGSSIACVALRGGETVGAGSLQVAQRVCELVGIATLPEHRRRGVATAVSLWLARAHFAAGGDLVWLTAGDGAAEAVYRRIGFRRVESDQLDYEPA